jgi:hypothetical protein
MANTIYRDRLVLAFPSLDQATGQWKVTIEITHTLEKPERFSTREAAETFGLKFAQQWIDDRP